MTFITFDIETATPAPDDRAGSYDLGVTCAATSVGRDDAYETQAWCGDSLLRGYGPYAARMGAAHVGKLVKWLLARSRNSTVVGWNALGFDFRVLWHSAPAEMQSDIVQMALDSIDPFYQMVCERGYGIGLDTAAKGLGLKGKSEGMDGLKAIEMWQEDRDAQDQVLTYVEQDAEVTARVYRTILAAGRLTWVSRSGRTNAWSPILAVNGHDERRMLTVREASTRIPQPDTSWMSRPWDREDFYGWTGWAPKVEGVGEVALS